MVRQLHMLAAAMTGVVCVCVALAAPEVCPVANEKPPAARVGAMTLEEAKGWWAFVPVRRPDVPSIKSANPIDAFISESLAARKLMLSPAADKQTLIRRATYDLTGLPPTREEVADFIADGSPDAFAKVVDRLLQSPRYGEKWGRHWLDLVRYADTAGENSDHPLPHAWRYRNWVIEAHNRDVPYDQFLREQLAGDLMADAKDPKTYASLITATGFLAVARRFGHDTDKDMHLTHEDVIDTLGKAVLGLSIGCARCHDHKYDPISAEDYYALYGIFDSTKFAFPGCEAKQQPRDMVVLVPPEEWKEKTRPYEGALTALEAKLKAAPEGEAKAAAKKELDEHVARRPVPDLAYAVTEGEVKNARLHVRGEPTKPGAEVPRRWLAVLGGQELRDAKKSGRLELAQWVTDPANPLTARVMVNRIWQNHFGKGLVGSPSDFGTRGQKPTHPELLDWLAAEFVASGWSVKAMHRRIMLSETYRQSSGENAAGTERDPTNELYGRFDRRRLSAEELRDTLLVVGGNLDATPGGPHPFPPESQWNFTQHDPFKAAYETNKRSVYALVRRNTRDPFMGLFDGADPNATTAQRQATTVPTQSLYFMNSEFFHAQAAALAARLPAVDAEPRVGALFGIVLQREPTERERVAAVAFVKNYEAELAGGASEPGEIAAWAALARVVLGGNEFVYLD